MCTVPKLFLIEEIMEQKEAADMVAVDRGEEDPGQFFLDEELEISLNAITGTPNPKTMKIIGVLRNQQVVILTDSGSTHNFVDAKLAEVLGIISTSGDAIKVRIANGQIISSPGKSQHLTFKMQGNLYKMDLYILPLAGCDIVLGIQWLRVLGPILWDFDHLTMEFQYGSKRCVLQGLQQGPQLSLEDRKAFKWLNKAVKGLCFRFFQLSYRQGKKYTIRKVTC